MSFFVSVWCGNEATLWFFFNRRVDGLTAQLAEFEDVNQKAQAAEDKVKVWWYTVTVTLTVSVVISLSLFPSLSCARACMRTLACTQTHTLTHKYSQGKKTKYDMKLPKSKKFILRKE